MYNPCNTKMQKIMGECLKTWDRKITGMKNYYREHDNSP